MAQRDLVWCDSLLDFSHCHTTPDQCKTDQKPVMERYAWLAANTLLLGLDHYHWTAWSRTFLNLPLRQILKLICSGKFDLSGGLQHRAWRDLLGRLLPWT